MLRCPADSCTTRWHETFPVRWHLNRSVPPGLLELQAGLVDSNFHPLAYQPIPNRAAIAVFQAAIRRRDGVIPIERKVGSSQFVLSEAISPSIS